MRDHASPTRTSISRTEKLNGEAMDLAGMEIGIGGTATVTVPEALKMRKTPALVKETR